MADIALSFNAARDRSASSCSYKRFWNASSSGVQRPFCFAAFSRAIRLRSTVAFFTSASKSSFVMYVRYSVLINVIVSCNSCSNSSSLFAFSSPLPIMSYDAPTSSNTLRSSLKSDDGRLLPNQYKQNAPNPMNANAMDVFDPGSHVQTASTRTLSLATQLFASTTTAV